MIGKAERPFIYYGGGVEISDAGSELLALMRKAEIPSAHTMMAIGCVPDDDELSLGMIGMHGTVSADWAVERSDLLICIGARFSDRVATNTGHFAPGARIIHVDIDAAEINKNIETTYSVVSDAKTFLQKILPYIKENRHAAWLAQINEWRAKLDYHARTTTASSIRISCSARLRGRPRRIPSSRPTSVSISSGARSTTAADIRVSS